METLAFLAPWSTFRHHHTILGRSSLNGCAHRWRLWDLQELTPQGTGDLGLFWTGDVPATC